MNVSICERGMYWADIKLRVPPNLDSFVPVYKALSTLQSHSQKPSDTDLHAKENHKIPSREYTITLFGLTKNNTIRKAEQIKL